MLTIDSQDRGYPPVVGNSPKVTIFDACCVVKSDMLSSQLAP